MFTCRILEGQRKRQLSISLQGFSERGHGISQGACWYRASRAPCLGTTDLRVQHAVQVALPHTRQLEAPI